MLNKVSARSISIRQWRDTGLSFKSYQFIVTFYWGSFATTWSNLSVALLFLFPTISTQALQLSEQEDLCKSQIQGLANFYLPFLLERAERVLKKPVTQVCFLFISF
jgi:hypothetical protein